jgi:alpha-L-rhamnosidase
MIPHLIAHTLTTDAVAEPLGLTRLQPVLAWRLRGTGRQAAATVEVQDAAGSPVWSSGRLSGAAQRVVCGCPLSSGGRYAWRVRVEDADGNDGGWSAWSAFGTAWDDPTAWPGVWLAGPEEGQQLVHQRAEFTAACVVSARLHIAVGAAAAGNQTLRMNAFEAFLNGERVGDEVVSPGQIAPEGGRALVRSFEVLPMLRQGKNALGLRHAASVISAVLVLYHEDGSSRLALDGPWRQGGGGAFVQLWPRDGRDEQGGKGEIHDARQDHTGWAAPGFDESAWSPAVIAAPARALSAQHQPMTVQAVHPPRTISEPQPGKQVVDFGQNTHGFVRLRVRGAACDRITVRYAENLLPDPRPVAEIPVAWKDNFVALQPIAGTIDWTSTRNHGQKDPDAQSDTFILADDQLQVLAPRFATHGFRYVEISGLRSPPADLDAVTVHSPVLSGSSFACSHPLLERLHHLAHWSMRTNLLSVPTDCPHRERNGWLGDALCLAQAECLMFDLAAFLDLWLTQIGDAQGPDGFVPIVVPFGKPIGLQDLPWQSGLVLVAWDAWEAHGDRDVLARHYPAMRRWWDFTRRFADADGYCAEGTMWGDWVCLEGAGKPFLGNAYLLRATDLLAAIAGILDHQSEAAAYRSAAARHRAAILRQHRGPDGAWDNGSQSALAHVLAFDLCAQAERPAVLAALVGRLARDGRITTGCLGTWVLLPVLSEAGRDDLVLGLASDPDHNWGYWVTRCDATTGLETWTGDRTQSYNHPFLMGSLAAWFYRRLGGITPLEPGYAWVGIAPYYAPGLDHAAATVETVRGLVRSVWRRQGAGIRLEVEVPAGATAQVVRPDGVRVEVGSGWHRFA